MGIHDFMSKGFGSGTGSLKNDKKRGREAFNPAQISLRGWRDILLRVKNQISKDNVGIVAAGIAFYVFLAIFPILIATIMIYGLVVDPHTVRQQLQALTGIMPQQARDLLENMLGKIAGDTPKSLGWGATISILLALWSANKGMKAMFQGINIAYNEEENRGFIKQNLITLFFTVGAIVLLIISALLVVAFPVALGKLDLPYIIGKILDWGRWLMLAFLIQISLAVIYRFAPVRRGPRWQWVSWGAVIAVILWIIGSWGFSFYVSRFGSYNKTYGSLAAVVILMLWFLLTSFIVLLGAEINSEMERQTRRDSTVGEAKPMGERNAEDADHLAKSP
jgi:membrane protein